MKISKFFKQQFLLFFAAIFLSFAFLASKRLSRPAIFIPKQESTLNLNNKLTQFFHIGQKRLISSSMWIATILESDLDHYKMKDLNSWMFLRFKTISELEPRFYENYQYGGIYLSIVKDDLPGASYIYELGLKEFPDDYFLLKNSAFHYEFEVGDQEKSFKIYQKLKVHPQVDFITMGIVARLESHIGRREVAFELLKGQYDKIADKNSIIGKAIYNHLYAIKAELDLDCLNTQGKTKCLLNDFDGNRYLKINGYFQAQKKWEPFRMKDKKQR